MIEVNGEQLDLDTLSDKSKYFNAQVQSLNEQIGQAEFKMAQLHASKQVFENSFIESLEEDEE